MKISFVIPCYRSEKTIEGVVISDKWYNINCMINRVYINNFSGIQDAVFNRAGRPLVLGCENAGIGKWNG